MVQESTENVGPTGTGPGTGADGGTGTGSGAAHRSQTGHGSGTHPGSGIVAPLSLPMHTRLGEFEVIDVIGEGGFSIVGMPGTPGFDAAHLVLEAAIEHFGALPTVAAALGNVAAAGFLLWAFQRAFLAPLPEGAAVRSIERVRPMEYLLGGLTLFVLLAAGFLPEPWLILTEAATQAVAARFGS